MTVSRATSDDLDWIVGVLARRREALVPHAPIFWGPAVDATARHRTYIGHLLTTGAANAYRTDDAVLIAVRSGNGWLVDDMSVPGDGWAVGAGGSLWNAFDANCHGETVRFVCPTHERERWEFARTAGLDLAESWWLLELADTGGGEAGVQVKLPGANAITVAAPPVYAPPGPNLFLPAPIGAASALRAAVARAPELGCAGIVVNHVGGDDDLARALTGSGFRRHCDFFTGTIDPITTSRNPRAEH